MIRKKEEKTGAIVIDITGPDGNAFVLMGYATRYAKQLGYTPEQYNQLMDDMQSSDYENLLQVFDDHFGTFVILER